MGYSKNPGTVRKIEAELSEIAAGRSTTWVRKDEASADKWAYKIHEALWLASRLPHLFPALARAHKAYAIKVEGSVVTALLRFPLEPLGPDTPTAATPVQTHTLAGAQGVPEIVQFWISHQPSNDELSLVDAYLSNAEFDELVRWAHGLSPAWEVHHIAGTASIVVRPGRNRALTSSVDRITSAVRGATLEPEILG